MIFDETSNDSHGSQLQFVRSQSAAAKNQSNRNAKKDKPPKPVKVTACVVFSPDLIGDAAMNEAIQANFVHYSMRSEVDENGGRFHFYASPCDTVTSIRWTKQDLRGANPSEAQFEPYILQVIDNDTFIDLVLQSVNGFEFQQLGSHLEQLFQPHVRVYQRSRVSEADDADGSRSRSRSYCKEVAVTKVMALINLDPAILKAQRKVGLCMLYAVCCMLYAVCCLR
jgi:hypothetical protein